MVEDGSSNKSDANYPDRKAHASLAQVENQLLAGIRNSIPSLVEEDGSCPQCVTLEHELADEYQAQATASEMTQA